MSQDIKSDLSSAKTVMEAYERGDEQVVERLNALFAEQRRDFGRLINNIRRGDGFIQAKTVLPADGITPWIHGNDLVRVGASLGERLLDEDEDYACAPRIRFKRPVTQDLDLYVAEDRGKLPEVESVLEMNLVSSKGRLLHCIAEFNGQPVKTKITPDIFLLQLLASLQTNGSQVRFQTGLKPLVTQQLGSATERLVASFDLATFVASTSPVVDGFKGTLIASVDDLRVPPKDWMVNGLEFSVRALGPKKPASSGAQIQDVGIDIEAPEKRSLAQVRFALCKSGRVDSSGKLSAY